MPRPGSAAPSALRRLRALAGGALLAIALAGPAAAQLLQVTPQQVALTTNYCFSDVRCCVADLDGNGFPDVVMVGTTNCSEVRVMMNPGQVGLTASPVVSAVPNGVFNGAVTDLNQDGYPDYLVFQNSAITAYLNVGPGTLVLSGPTPVVSTPALYLGGFMVADLNGDGVDEIVAHYWVTTPSTGVPLGFRVWTNTLNGLGTGWAPGPMVPFPTTFAGAANSSTRIAALKDINLDGFIDVLFQSSTTVGNTHPVYAVTYLGGGNLTFGPPQVVALPGGIIAVGDVDNDGFPDIVTLSQSVPLGGGVISEYRVCYGAATQAFANTVVVNGATTDLLDYTPVDIVDLDGDGLPDLVEHSAYAAQPYSPTCSTRLRVFRNLGNRQFSAPWTLADVPSPNCMTAPNTFVLGLRPIFADFDNDGDMDMLMVPAYGNVAPLRYIRNDSHFGLGAAGYHGLTPGLFFGNPVVGNGAFAIMLGNASPNSAAVLGLSLLRDPAAAPNGILLDLSPQSVLLPNGAQGFVTTSATGFAMVTLPIPNHPALINFTAYAQWGVVDPIGTYNTAFGNFALTQGHAFIVR